MKSVRLLLRARHQELKKTIQNLTKKLNTFTNNTMSSINTLNQSKNLAGLISLSLKASKQTRLKVF